MKTAQLLRMAIVLSVWTTSSGNFVDFLDSVEDKIRQFTSAKPNKIVQDVKNIFMGLPFEVGFQAIDAYCQASKLTDRRIRKKEQAVASKLQLVFKRPSKNYFWNLSEPQSWDLVEFDAKKSLTLFISGWTTHYDSKENNATYAAHQHLDDINNFLVVDAAAYLDTAYYWAAYNTEKIGQLIGAALVELGNVGPIHCIGHSLGGHVCSSAAKEYFNLKKVKFARNTGLDVANPCFYGKNRYPGLSAGDANFVDVIHTDARVLGIGRSVGDADVFVNTRMPLQPGCLTVLCSHNRAWELYAESASRSRASDFLATPIKGGPPIPVGFAMPMTAVGDYHLKTMAKTPFGLNAAEYQKKTKIAGS